MLFARLIRNTRRILECAPFGTWCGDRSTQNIDHITHSVYFITLRAALALDAGSSLTYRHVRSIVSHRKRRPSVKPFEMGDSLELNHESVELVDRVVLRTIVYLGVHWSTLTNQRASQIQYWQGISTSSKWWSVTNRNKTVFVAQLFCPPGTY